MIADLVYQLETDIIAEIARSLSTGAVASADWKIKKMSELGALNKDIAAIIAKYKKLGLAEMAGDSVGMTADTMLDEMRAAVPKQYRMLISMTPALQNTVNLWIASATSDTNLAMAKLAQQASAQYVASISKASLSVLSGSETLQKSVMKSIHEMAINGLPVFTDKLGRNWSPEGYVSMVVRTNQVRAAKEVMFAAGDQAGTDLIEVSSHIGARPLCAPYQGTILSRSGKTPGYMALSATSYGKPAGLFGINCGHIAYPFFPGMSRKTYSPYPEKENAKQYQESQQQRGLERNVRRLKRLQQVSIAEGDKINASAYGEKVKAAQADLREFIDNTGRTRRYDREKIYTQSK